MIGKRRISLGLTWAILSVLLVVAVVILCAFLLGPTQATFAADAGEPQAHSIVPACGYPGQRLDFVIGGINLPTGESASVILPSSSYVVARNCFVSDNHTISGGICVAEDAPRGWYDLEVHVASTDIAVGTVKFEVQAMPNPTVTSVEPQKVKQGEVCTMSIGGKGFPKGATATICFVGGTGIPPVQGHVDEWNMITADVAVGDSADLGSRDLLVSFNDPQVTAAPFADALQVKQSDFADLKLLGIVGAAMLGGIVSGLLGWIDEEKGRAEGTSLRHTWSWRKFFRTLLISFVAGAGFTVGYQQFDSLQLVHYLVAFLGGAGGDALTNRFLGATETVKAGGGQSGKGTANA
jgi:hypothetical protein